MLHKVLGAFATLLSTAPPLSARAALLDRACESPDQAGETEADVGLRLAEAFRSQLVSFGSSELPLAREHVLGPAELTGTTGLSAAAFVPQPAQDEAKLGAAGSVIAAQLALVAIGLSKEVPLKVLRDLEWWQLPSIILGATAGSTLLLILADRLAGSGRLLRAASLVLSPERREVVLRHEAGHFLVAHLLGCPVQACRISPWEYLLSLGTGAPAGTVFFSSALCGAAAEDAEERAIDVASVVLMAGIAAEAASLGKASLGGASDEAALRALLERHGQKHGQQHAVAGGGGLVGESHAWSREEAAARATARWAVANAVLLIAGHRAAYEALCAALRRGASVGECLVELDDSIRCSPSASPVSRVLS